MRCTDQKRCAHRTFQPSSDKHFRGLDPVLTEEPPKKQEHRHSTIVTLSRCRVALNKHYHDFSEHVGPFLSVVKYFTNEVYQSLVHVKNDWMQTMSFLDVEAVQESERILIASLIAMLLFILFIVWVLDPLING